MTTFSVTAPLGIGACAAPRPVLRRLWAGPWTAAAGALLLSGWLAVVLAALGPAVCR